MKGYMISPFLFIVLTIIVFSLSFHFSQTDSSISKSLTKEGEIKYVFFNSERELALFATEAFETMYTGYDVNNITMMEASIATNILHKFNRSVTVAILNGSHKMTRVRFSITAFTDIGKDYILSLNNTNYETVIGHPFYDYSQIYLTFDPHEACNGSAPLMRQQFENKMNSKTNLTWNATNYGTDPIVTNRVIFWDVRIYDQGNIVTQVPWYYFKLDNRNNSGTYFFNVTC